MNVLDDLLAIVVDGKKCVGIPLTKEMTAIVDREDAEKVLFTRWRALRGAKDKSLWYADSGTKKSGSRLMHRFLLQVPKHLKVDHKNGNGLDNRRCNLRPATHSQNLGNRKKNIRGSSQFKGVSWRKKIKKWTAKISLDRHQCYLGDYISEIDAARAYNAAALKQWGEFARLNIIPGETLSETI